MFGLVYCLPHPNGTELFPCFKSSNPRNKSENPMVQLFYGTFLTEGIREGKSSALNVNSQLVTTCVFTVERLESQTNAGLNTSSASLMCVTMDKLHDPGS